MYACPLTAGPECPHTKDGADHVPLIFLSTQKDVLQMFSKNQNRYPYRIFSYLECAIINMF